MKVCHVPNISTWDSIRKRVKTPITPPRNGYQLCRSIWLPAAGERTKRKCHRFLQQWFVHLLVVLFMAWSLFPCLHFFELFVKRDRNKPPNKFLLPIPKKHLSKHKRANGREKDTKAPNKCLLPIPKKTLLLQCKATPSKFKCWLEKASNRETEHSVKCFGLLVFIFLFLWVTLFKTSFQKQRKRKNIVQNLQCCGCDNEYLFFAYCVFSWMLLFCFLFFPRFLGRPI